MVFKSL